MQPLNDQQLEELQLLILREQKISAIGKYREMTGAGLAEAKDAIETLHARMRAQGTQLSTSPQLAGSQLEEVQNLIFRNQKISAITKYREFTGVGLKDAKGAVESMDAQLRSTRAHEYTPAPKGCAAVLVCILLVIVAALFARSIGFAAGESNSLPVYPNESVGVTNKVYGWKNAKWGMTADQVLQKFPGEAVRREKPRIYFDSQGLVEIRSLEIVGHIFRVDFIFSIGDKTLVQVNLTPLDASAAAETWFPKLDQSLAEKYGKPEESSDSHAGETESIQHERSWKRGPTRIELTFRYFKITDDTTFVLSYRKVTENDTDNL